LRAITSTAASMIWRRRIALMLIRAIPTSIPRRDPHSSGRVPAEVERSVR
jgi:hypothetical protein